MPHDILVWRMFFPLIKNRDYNCVVSLNYLLIRDGFKSFSVAYLLQERSPYASDAEKRIIVYKKDMEAYKKNQEECKKKSVKPIDVSDKIQALSLSNEEKAPLASEAEKRKVVHNKNDKQQEGQKKSELCESDEPIDVSDTYQFLSPFGVFMEKEFAVNKERVTSMDKYLSKWDSMLESEKSPYVSLAAERMAEHEKVTIAYVAEMMDQIPIGYDEADETDDESEEEACEASSGFLAFFNEFSETYKKVDSTPAAVVIGKKVQEWELMTESEKEPYYAQAKKLMDVYDAELISLFQGSDDRC
ncbi:unnamed protein product [Microthlaspi erraticum]|uniref:Uncharacterized protein n=1 Tax=Microthlaspi erraticum TaxID=1685480 RepID=A0A6D2J3Y5_9BRAS|nr:unnamed protein product [Microthlaspi erraticum]